MKLSKKDAEYLQTLTSKIDEILEDFFEMFDDWLFEDYKEEDEIDDELLEELK